MEVRDFLAKPKAGLESFVAAEEAELEVADMNRVFCVPGGEIYPPPN